MVCHVSTSCEWLTNRGSFVAATISAERRTRQTDGTSSLPHFLLSSPPLGSLHLFTHPSPSFSVFLAPQLVELKNGETYNGHMIACDNFMNVTLRDVILTAPEGDKFHQMKEVYLKGNVVSAFLFFRCVSGMRKVAGDAGCVRSGCAWVGLIGKWQTRG